jgi:hypothetical protein
MVGPKPGLDTEKASSMGFRSGEYAGRYMRRIPLDKRKSTW